MNMNEFIDELSEDYLKNDRCLIFSKVFFKHKSIKFIQIMFIKN
jgi:hypothetical protein